MDQLPDAIQENTRCGEDRNQLIEQLMLFCGHSALTGETKASCVKKRVASHDAVCAFNGTDGMVRQIYNLKEHFPHKTIDQLCRLAYQKKPNEFQSYLNSTSTIVENTPNVVTLSQSLSFESTTGDVYNFDRATFNNWQKMLWWAYPYNDTPSEWNVPLGRRLDLGDGDEFEDIVVSVDDDLTLHLLFTHDDEEFHSIPYIKASALEMDKLIQHLKGMNIEVRDLRDPRMDEIRLALSKLA